MSAAFDRDYYEANYRDYQRQNPVRKMRFYRQLIEGLVPPEKPARLLEIGCAFGRFAQFLPAAWTYFGTDLSRYALKNADEAGGRLCQASADGLPFDAAFDAVAAFDVLEHVPRLDLAAESIAGALRPGGAFVFVVPVYDGPTGPVIRALDKDPTHVHKESRWFWLDWAAAGFEVCDWWGVYRYLLPGGCYVHSPTRRLRRWTPAIAVVGKT